MTKLHFLLTTLVFFYFILFFPALTQAADLYVDCPTSPTMCSKSGLDPLFSDSLDGFWYPGKTITKTLNLKNSDLETKEMVVRGTRTSTVNILEDVMHISIVGGTTVIWSGLVADFYNQDRIGMGNFTPGADLDYDFTVSMSSVAGNEYQNRKTVFGLTLGFWEEPVLISPTSTPIPGVVAGISTTGMVPGFQENVLGVKEELDGEVSGGIATGGSEMVKGSSTAHVYLFWKIVTIITSVIIIGIIFRGYKRKL